MGKEVFFKDTAPKVGNVPLNRSVAEDLIANLHSLVDRASLVGDSVNSKLRPIMRQVPPEDNTVCKNYPDWPPFFAEIREKFLDIEHSLYRTERALDLTEL